MKRLRTYLPENSSIFFHSHIWTFEFLGRTLDIQVLHTMKFLYTWKWVFVREIFNYHIKNSLANKQIHDFNWFVMTLYIYIYIQLLVRMTFFFIIYKFLLFQDGNILLLFFTFVFFSQIKDMFLEYLFYLLKYINNASNDLSTLWASCIILYIQVPRWSRWSKPFLFIKIHWLHSWQLY